MAREHILDTIDPAVIGERLADARRARGLTQQQVAKALGVARTTVTAIEKGVRRPRASELVTLARLYGQQVGDLVRARRQEPDVSFVLHFRATGNRAEVIPEADRVADSQRFEEFCRWYVELEDLLGTPLPRRYPEEYDISHTPPERAAEEVASLERNRLGLGDGPIGDLWGVLEGDVGLRVFALPMRSKQIAEMFIYSETLGGCIAVNARHPEGRRRWSLVHGYAHFLVDRSKPRISTVSVGRRIPDNERFADAFGRYFLMPESGLVQRFHALRRAKPELTVADLLALSHQYRVSFQALVLRLEELDLIPEGTWRELNQRGFKPDQARKHLALTPHAPDPSFLPPRYELLAAQAFDQGLITEGQLARMLATDRVSARERISRLLLAERAENGEWRQAPLDLSVPVAGMAT